MKKFFGRLKDGKSVLIFSESNENLPLVENEFIFPAISADAEKEFQPDYKLVDGEWFYVNINANDKAQMIAPYLASAESTVDVNNIKSGQYKELAALYLVSCTTPNDSNGKTKIIFNRIFNKFYIASKMYLKFINSGEAAVSAEKNVVEFNGSVDAYWDDATSKLYFKSYLTIKPLFKGISKFYRIATSEEVASFVNGEFFKVAEGFRIESLGERARKYIADIIDEKLIDFTDTEIRKEYNKYAVDYPEAGLAIDADGKFILNNASDLTHAINFLQEKYYTSSITHQKRVAHSTSNIH